MNTMQNRELESLKPFGVGRRYPLSLEMVTAAEELPLFKEIPCLNESFRGFLANSGIHLSRHHDSLIERLDRPSIDIRWGVRYEGSDQWKCWLTDGRSIVISVDPFIPSTMQFISVSSCVDERKPKTAPPNTVNRRKLARYLKLTSK